MGRLTTLLIALLLTAPTVVAAAGGAGTQTTPTDEAHERLVVDLDSSLKMPLDAALAALDGEHVRTDERLGFAVVYAPQQALAELLGGGVHPDRPAHLSSTPPQDPLWDDQWGPQYLEMPRAWDVEDGEHGVLVGIVDSGFSPEHPDLDDVPVEVGYDYVDRDQTPIDEDGHGTHVAGIIAAERDNGEGIAGIADVSLFVTRVFGGPSGWCAAVASAIVDAADAGAEVINFSGHCTLIGPMQDAVSYAAASDALVVTANGNEGDDLQECLIAQDPNPNPALLSIGAIGSSGRIAPYSCRSPYVDLAAPGSGVLSTVPSGYAYYSGTSMATPHVTGIAALIESYMGDPPAQTVRSILVSTADDAGEPGWDPAFGYGIVDPVQALNPVTTLEEVPP